MIWFVIWFDGMGGGAPPATAQQTLMLMGVGP